MPSLNSSPTSFPPRSPHKRAPFPVTHWDRQARLLASERHPIVFITLRGVVYATVIGGFLGAIVVALLV
jgi:hypothetical protein